MVEMDNNNHNYWRKKTKEENFNGGSRSRSQNHNNNNNNRRSSFGNGRRQQQSELSLEKKFCAIVGRVSWQKVLDTQKYMYQDEKVINWEDSAVLEAFSNAKNRFWAEMLGKPCDLKLPDPDIFIDKIDWDSNVDPDLLLDLEKRDPDIPCETDQKYSGVVIGIPVVPEQYVFSSMGWGDVEEGDEQLNNLERHDSLNNAEKGCSNSGWGDVKEEEKQLNNPERHGGVYNAEKVCSNNGWEDDHGHWGDNGVNNVDKVRLNSGWGDNYDHSGDKGENNSEKGFSNSGWEDGFVYIAHDMDNCEDINHNGGSTWNGCRNNKCWDYGGGYYKKSDHGSWNTSRYKISRFHHNGNQSFIDDFGSNKRGNFSSSKRPLRKWKPVSRQW